MNIIEAMEEAKRIGAKGIHRECLGWYLDTLFLARYKLEEKLVLGSEASITWASAPDWEPYIKTVDFAEAYIEALKGRHVRPVSGFGFWTSHDFSVLAKEEWFDKYEKQIRGQWVIADLLKEEEKS